jgi:hypothetical protein
MVVVELVEKYLEGLMPEEAKDDLALALQHLG